MIGQDCLYMSLDQVKSPRPMVFEFTLGWKAPIQSRKSLLFLHAVQVDFSSVWEGQLT